MATNFPHVRSGMPKSKSPANNAAWLNAVSAATSHYQNTVAAGKSGGHRPGAQQQPNRITICNNTEQDLERGHIVEVDEYELDEINHRKHWFTGVKPTEDDVSNFAIITKAVKQDKRGPALKFGVMTCMVNVTDKSHTHVTPEKDKVVGKSSTEGAIKILSKLEETGEQEVTVEIGGSSGGGATIVVGRAIEYIPGSGGSLLADSEDANDVLELDGTYDIERGKVRPFQAEPLPDPIPDPLPDPEPWQEIEDWDDTQEEGQPPPTPPDPMIYIEEEWYNFMPDGILKNALVIGMKSGSITWIISASATTLQKPWSS